MLSVLEREGKKERMREREHSGGHLLPKNRGLLSTLMTERPRERMGVRMRTTKEDEKGKEQAERWSE